MSNHYQRWTGIMKAYPFEEKRLLKYPTPYIIQPKFDGIRCRAIHISSGYILLSSEENIIFSVPHINKQLNNSKLTYELDGELYCHGMTFEEIISITSRTVNIHPEHEKISFHIFDVINDESQLERLAWLEYRINLFFNNLILTPYWLAENLEEVMKIYNGLINDDYEGMIVRNLYAPYERKRSTNIMKFKPKKSDVYEIVGYVEELSNDGERKNTLGALKCVSGDGKTFNVGTGFSANQRKLLWIKRYELLGYFAKIQYQHITSGNKVPRFPVFVEIVNNLEGE